MVIPPGWVVVALMVIVLAAALGVTFAFLGDVADRTRGQVERAVDVREAARLSVERRPWADTDRQSVPVQAMRLERPGMHHPH